MTIEYKLRTTGDGDVICCESCGCEVATSEFGKSSISLRDQKQYLCEFCATTMAGTYVEYSSRDEFTAIRSEIWKAAACVFNMLKERDK